MDRHPKACGAIRFGQLSPVHEECPDPGEEHPPHGRLHPDWMSAAERATAEVGTMEMIEHQRSLQSASNRLRIDWIHEDYELSKIVLRITGRIGHDLFAVPSSVDSEDDKTARAEAMHSLVQLTSEAAQYLAILVSAPRGSARHDSTRVLFRELAPDLGVDPPGGGDFP